MMQNNISKKILALLLAILFAGGTMAQSTSKEINDIKRNTAYLYAESTMDSESDAREVANELLMKQVEEYIASKYNLSDANNVLIKDIQSKYESLTMMRGTMYRVFVYVNKNDIEGVSNTTVINSQSGVRVTISDNPSTIVNVTGNDTETNNHESELAEEVSTNEIAYKKGNGDSNDERPAPDNDENVADPPDEMYNNSSFVPDNMANIDKMSNLKNRIQEEQSQSPQMELPLSGWKLEAIYLLMDCSDINAVRARLNRLKAEYKVKRYGAPDNCPSREKSFWVVFDDSGKVVTVLGEGMNERYDFKNKTMSTLDYYKGMNALWFTLSK